VTPARRELARWAIAECTRPRELSARVQALAREEGVKPPTVWRSMVAVIRDSLDARKEALRLGGYPPMHIGSGVTVILHGPAVGQGRPRIMGGRAAGSGLASEWARLRAESAWVQQRELGPVLCADAFMCRIEVYRPKGRLVKPDPDNVAKLHLDALGDAGCIVNDARCRSLAVDVLAGQERVQVMLIACL
jgi:Holliday junction resolvase RusA-like endonuclease